MSVNSIHASLAELAASSTPPIAYPASDFHEDGIESLYFEGLPFQGRQTRVFCWRGIPEVPEGTLVPGMVLVHGGGYTASADWVKLWMSRGYAAIAMDLNGATPRQVEDKWQRHAFAGPIGCSGGQDGLDQLDWPVEDQWQYHATAAVILANSLLRSVSGVDPNRIGITGVSWGAVVTLTALAADTRFRFGAPVYGCGFMDAASCWFRVALDAVGETAADKWRLLWDPANALPKIQCPLLWVTGTNDYFPLDSLQHSYHIVKSARDLAVRVRMPHAHNGPGENPPEIPEFAAHILDNQPALPQIGKPWFDGKMAYAQFDTVRPIEYASLVSTSDPGEENWRFKHWEESPASIDLTAGTISALVGSETISVFFNLGYDNGCIASSEHFLLSKDRIS